MPFLRTIAGPDGEDETVREVELGDPADVSIEGLRVAISEDASILPVSLELRNARIRAAKALREAGADVARVSLPGAKTVLQPYLNAMRESGALREILDRGTAPRCPPLRRLLADAVRRPQPLHDAAPDDARDRERSPIACPTRCNARPSRSSARSPSRSSEAIGDGVLLHPPFARVAPRHGLTVGRPWMLGQQARLQPRSASRRPRSPRAQRARACRSGSRLPPAATATMSRSRSRSSSSARSAAGSRLRLRPELLDGQLAVHALLLVVADGAVDLVGAGLEVDRRASRSSPGRSCR